MLDCSPIKRDRELGSDRRETGWSLSGVGVGNLRRYGPSTRGLDCTSRWCFCCPAKGSAE